MTKIATVLTALSLAMTATAADAGKGYEMGKCITEDGNVFDCRVMGKNHQLTAQDKLGNGFAEETNRASTRSERTREEIVEALRDRDLRDSIVVELSE